MGEECRYIFSEGELIRKDNSILLKTINGNNYIPIEKVKELYLFNDITLSTKLLSLLGKAGIIIHFFDYYGNYTGTYYPKEIYLSGNLTVKQAIAYQNKRVDISKSIVKGISLNLYFLLYHYYRHGTKEIKDNIEFIKKAEQNLNKAQNINQVMAIEASIWKSFYDCFKSILPEEFMFNKRVRRPPDNPLNALISFGNSVLYSKTISQIYQTHLNQTISFLHEPSEGRFSLSLDLSENFKFIVFKTIFYCVNNKLLKIDKHFEQKVNYCMLNEEGKKIFLKELNSRLDETYLHPILKRNVSYRESIKLDGYKLIKYIIEDKPFIPFNLENKK